MFTVEVNSIPSICPLLIYSIQARSQPSRWGGLNLDSWNTIYRVCRRGYGIS